MRCLQFFIPVGPFVSLCLCGSVANCGPVAIFRDFMKILLIRYILCVLRACWARILFYWRCYLLFNDVLSWGLPMEMSCWCQGQELLCSCFYFSCGCESLNLTSFEFFIFNFLKFSDRKLDLCVGPCASDSTFSSPQQHYLWNKGAEHDL